MSSRLVLLFCLSVVTAAGIGFAAGHSHQGRMVSSADWQWQPIREGSPIDVIVLWGDPGAGGDHARLLKLPAGFTVPNHAHTGDYHAVSLTGTWRHSFEEGQPREEMDLPQGSYVFQPGGAMHGDACIGSEDCVLLLHQHEKADFIPQAQN